MAEMRAAAALAEREERTAARDALRAKRERLREAIRRREASREVAEKTCRGCTRCASVLEDACGKKG